MLHVGCVDTGLLETRIAAGSLLHLRLAAVTTELWGYDINADGIARLRELGFERLLVGDASTIDQLAALRDRQFDVILVSEVVEHLQNPGLFFQAVQALMVEEHTRLVVTVPNAFRIATLLRLLGNVEYVHPDHNYWFSYVTLRNLIRKNGLQLEEFMVYTFEKHHIVPKRFSRRQGGPVVDPQTTPGGAPRSASEPRRPLPVMAASYVRQLPRRLLATLLLRRSVFWGDGLIAIATRSPARN